jgi:hypothetical protein
MGKRREEKELAEQQILEEKEPVAFDTREYPVEVLIDRYQSGEFIIPNYQRNFVWGEDKEKMSKFIESIILDLPIPYLFFADEKESGKLEIVDGSQRIRTLNSFRNNEFELEGLEKLDLLNGFKFSDLLESRQRRLEYFNFINHYQPLNAGDNLFKILKSNMILMLYNLVESSIANAIEEIHNEIYENSTSFNSLRKELKKLIISQTKRIETNKFIETINDIATDIIKRSFQRKELFSGNVDRTTIAKLSAKYGFNRHTNYAKTKAGESLEEIKNKRNYLSHGIFSFTEVGKDYTIQDLEDIKDKTINYISDIIDNIELYLRNKEYCNN